MKALELKHISPYLPYGLNVTFEGDDCTHEVVGLSIASKGVELISPFGDYGRANIKDCRLILRPLSDLTKEIEHNGEQFVFSDVYLSNVKIKQITGEEYSTFNNFLNDVDYNSIQLLFKYHFDIFGLIDKGLAIDINELNKIK